MFARTLNAGWRRAKLCGLDLSRLVNTHSFAVRQPRVEQAVRLGVTKSAGSNTIDKLLEVWAAGRYSLGARSAGDLLVDFGISGQPDCRKDFLE